MAKITYSELLKDPRWQKKRLAIFNRDKWTCQACWRNDKTLNVHHFEYKPDALPWEYIDDNFCTLCEECHELETTLRENQYFKTYSIKARIPAVILWYNMSTMAYLFSKDKKKAMEVLDRGTETVKSFDWSEFSEFIKVNG